MIFLKSSYPSELQTQAAAYAKGDNFICGET
jgi:hypothetical protein